MKDTAELMERVAKATGPDRELDAALIDLACERYVANHKWQLTKIGPDYDGNNACEIYTPNGKLMEGYDYPRRGVIWKYLHVRVLPFRAASFRESTDAAFAFIDAVIPGAFYLFGKGKTSAAEKLYGCQIMFGTDEVVGDGESNNAADAIILAALSARSALLASLVKEEPER